MKEIIPSRAWTRPAELVIGLNRSPFKLPTAVSCHDGLRNTPHQAVLPHRVGQRHRPRVVRINYKQNNNDAQTSFFRSQTTWWKKSF